MKKDECCSLIKVKEWDKKTFKWNKKPFVKDSLPTFFHMPFPPMIGKKIVAMWEKVQAAKCDLAMKDTITMFYDPSPWKSEIYMAVKKEVPGMENVKFTGTFMTRVYDGAYGEVPKWIKDMDAYLAGKKKKAKKYYIYYTCCPKCAKKFGHNYSVLFAEV